MRKFVVSLLLVFSVLYLNAGEVIQSFSSSVLSKMSPNLFEKIEFDRGKGCFMPKIQTENKLHILLKVFDSEKFKSEYAEYIGTCAGDIFTVVIPSIKIDNLISDPNIIYLESEVVGGPHLDIAREKTLTDEVYSNNMGQLPDEFRGKGVVCGVADHGFDYNHPQIFSEDGSEYRLKRVWEQAGNGNPPAGFAYGRELIDDDIIIAAGTDMQNMSHGTHVAGIMGGSGFGSDGKYRGVACESDLVYVSIDPEIDGWAKLSCPKIIDAYKYIIDYAEEQGKPCVINNSWGHYLGPKDGSSLFSQACENLAGPGKIIVISAGNAGMFPWHIRKSFTENDTLVQTFFRAVTNESTAYWVDLWGEKGSNPQVQFLIYNTETDEVQDSTQYYSTLMDVNQTIDMRDDLDSACRIKLTASVPAYNFRPRVFARVKYSNKDNNYRILLRVKDCSGTVDFTGYLRTDENFSFNISNEGKSWAESGDRNMMINDFISGRNIIGVASYTTKLRVKNINGNYENLGPGVVGQISMFSSIGPTTDGRMQPVIAAPGEYLVSGLSGYDNARMNLSYYKDRIVTCFNMYTDNKEHCFVPMCGTSMSSPMTAGAIALMLEINPKLDPEKIKTIFSETAIKDFYTGQAPDSSEWGFGKLNVFECVKEALKTTGISENMINRHGSAFPNPCNESINIPLKVESGEVHIALINSIGEIISQEIAISNGRYLSLNLKGISPGAYFVKVSSGGEVLSYNHFIKQ